MLRGIPLDMVALGGDILRSDRVSISGGSKKVQGGINAVTGKTVRGRAVAAEMAIGIALDTLQMPIQMAVGRGI